MWSLVDVKVEAYNKSSWACPGCSGKVVISRGYVVCAECGKATTVPFKPTQGGKPVLCRDCFKKK